MCDMDKKYTNGVICVLAGGISWGFSGACGQLLVNSPNITAERITAFRMIFAGIILTISNLAKNKKSAFDIFKSGKDALKLVEFALFGILLSQLTYIKTISYSNAGTATVLQYLGPVLIMLYTCLKNKKLPDKKEFAAVVLAFFGVTVIATHFNFADINLSGKCIAWGVASALGLALYSLIPCDIIKKYGAVSVTGFSMVIGGAAMSLYPGVITPEMSFDVQTVLAISGMVIVGTVLAYTLYLQGVASIGAVRASMLACVEPVSAALFSCFWLKTEFAPIDIIGFVMVLSTVFILSGNKK